MVPLKRLSDSMPRELSRKPENVRKRLWRAARENEPRIDRDLEAAHRSGAVTGHLQT
jgi:hypothetical protein